MSNNTEPKTIEEVENVIDNETQAIPKKSTSSKQKKKDKKDKKEDRKSVV